MRNSRKLLSLYGLKWNPFLPDLPLDGLWSPPGFETFLNGLEDLVMDGGFAMISGEPGLGKSKCLQMAAQRLSGLEDLIVGVMQRPQSSLGDFYREMGDLFGVRLTPANRYGGFKALRERWHDHIRTTLFRPVLLIDEAQEVSTTCLEEIRLLGSNLFDSQCLLTTVLCGDTRLPERFRSPALLSLGSRIRCRLTLSPHDQEALADYLDQLLDKAGTPHLMSNALKTALVTHACGNLRVLTNIAANLLGEASARELPQLDEKLFSELFARQPPPTAKSRRKAS